MKRVEIIANRSVEEETIEALAAEIPGIGYTLLPGIMGVGRQGKRLSSVTWPEENFILVCYIEDEAESRARKAIAVVKSRFPAEGIKIYSCPAD